MLLTYTDLLSESTLLFLTFAGAVCTALIVGVAFHEFSHAITADALGDHTARMMGRVNLNPFRHLDPMGTVFMFIGGFGWGKPTPVNPARLRYGPQTGRALVAAAGPVSNVLMAAIAAAPIQAGLVDWRSPFIIPSTVSGWHFGDYMGLYLSAVIVFNVVLAVFNLLPVAPLDGFSVAIGLLPRDLALSIARLEPYGPGILMLLIVAPFVTQGQISILHEIMSPFINGLTKLIVGQGNVIG
ncbi:MAG TPA: site-2 protease family protein [Dehalococcoidia bacterium]|nr:site-2 protease family protein [Dehalococcoidia bacterium]